MRKRLVVAMMVVGVLALAGSVPAYAQELSSVKVPFEFVVGETVMPAGPYVVRPLSSGSDAVSIQAADGKLVAMTIVQGTDWSKQEKASFSFQRIGGRYFLSSIRVPGGGMRAVYLPQDRVQAVLAKLNAKTAAPNGPGL